MALLITASAARSPILGKLHSFDGEDAARLLAAQRDGVQVHSGDGGVTGPFVKNKAASSRHVRRARIGFRSQR